MPPPNLDPATLRRAVQGDADALEELLRAVEPELRRELTIQPLWSRSLDADDVLQVSYLEAFLRVSSLREESPAAFRAWIGRLVQNNLTDAIRALERDKRPDPRRRVTRGAEGQSVRTLFGALAGEHPTAGGQLSLREETERLLEAVGKLPASYRQVVQLMDLEERPVAEASEIMGRSRGAVHLLRSRAHDRLRELLRVDSEGA